MPTNKYRIRIIFDNDLERRIEKRKQNKSFSKQVNDDLRTLYALQDMIGSQTKGTFDKEDWATLVEVAGNEKLPESLMEMWPHMIIAKLDIAYDGLKSTLIRKIRSLKPEQFAWAIDRVQLAARMA